jgi:hypothetical protein
VGALLYYVLRLRRGGWRVHKDPIALEGAAGFGDEPGREAAVPPP